MVAYQQVVMSLFTILLWGVNPILTRLCSDMIGIKEYMIITTIGSSTAILVINTFMNKYIWLSVIKSMFKHHNDLWKRWLIAVTDSVLCLAAPSILYNLMLSNTQSIAIVVTTTWYGAPIITSVISRYVFNQTLSYLQIGGIIVSIIGIAMMNIEEMIHTKKVNEEEHDRLLVT
jgi:drug/metabolite transporter (DMT)-like permease